MTAEQLATEPSTAIELYRPMHAHETCVEVGRISLDGFTMMENIESSWHDVREKLDGRIIGQPAAIDAIIEALEGSEARMPSDKRPIATLAFLGPTGVGKSETAKSLPEFIACSRKFVKIDCSDYSHGHEVANLTGAPVSYIGYGQEAALSKKRVEGFGTVVLFDEIEKGSPELFNLMLQILEDGELQLKNGETTSFREAIIILTSNLGAKEMSAQLSDTPLGFGGKNNIVSTSQLETVATKSFKEHFPPEFINRLSKMVVFHPLGSDQLGEVLDSKIITVNTEYEAELGARLSLSEATRQYLVDIASQEPSMGARPLVRALDQHVYTSFGRFYGSDAVPEGTHVKVFHRNELGLHVASSDSELVFMAKHDPMLKKAPIQEATRPDSTNTEEQTEAIDSAPEPDEFDPDED